MPSTRRFDPEEQRPPSSRSSREAPDTPVAVEPSPRPALPRPGDVLALQRHAGNAAVVRALARQAPAPTAAATASPAPVAAPAGPTEADKAEYELFKGDITDTTVEAYVKRRCKEFGDKEGSDTEYRKYAETADKEFEGIKKLIGQAEDSMERRKVLYRWLRKAYADAGITDAPGTIKARMTAEMKTKIDAVKDTLGTRTAGGFAARPQKISEDYILGTLSEHGTGKAVDITPEKNPQLPAGEWSWIKTFTGQSPDIGAAKWKSDPKAVWKGVNDMNDAFKKKLKEKLDEATKPAEAKPTEPATPVGSTAPTAAAAPTVAKADAPKPPPKREDALKDLLAGNKVLHKCVTENGEENGFFELPENLVVALHGQGLTWGVTFPNVDLHHFEMG